MSALPGITEAVEAAIVKRKGPRPKVEASDITRALASKHLLTGREIFFTEVNTGPVQNRPSGSCCRADALAIHKSWANPCFTIYEVKVSRSDFIGDRKWTEYLSYCHIFRFACPAGMIKPEELGPEIGLVWYYPETGELVTKRAGHYRNVEIPPTFLQSIIMAKLDSDRHPFFSHRRNYFEAFVRDKADKRLLGVHVGGKLKDHVHQLEDELSSLKLSSERWRQDAEVLEQVNSVLTPHGLRIYAHWPKQDIDRLKLALENKGTGLSREAVRIIKNLGREIDQLRQIVDPPVEEVKAG